MRTDRIKPRLATGASVKTDDRSARLSIRRRNDGDRQFGARPCASRGEWPFAVLRRRRRTGPEDSEDPGGLAAVAEQIRFEASLVVASAAVPDHSQCGEFNILLRALVSRAASPGIVVDVGACDRTGSNSYDLITSFGWRGILIEAYPARAAKLHEEFAGGKFEVAECAIGLAPAREKFWLGAGDLVNSLDRSVADLFGGQGKFVEVDVRRLADVLSDASVPHDFDVPRCLVPAIDGATTTNEWKEALWARFYTGAPRRQRSSVERYSIVKRA